MKSDKLQQNALIPLNLNCFHPSKVDEANELATAGGSCVTMPRCHSHCKVE